MLKVVYHLTLIKQNLKLVRFNFLILYLILINLTKNTTIKSIYIKKNIKTLLLSPFHYKVAKKNIIKKLTSFNFQTIVNVTKNKFLNFFLFKYWWYLHMYKTLPGLKKIQFNLKY